MESPGLPTSSRAAEMTVGPLIEMNPLGRLFLMLQEHWWFV